jgi:hypothetical protein
VGFVVDKVALEQVFSEYFGFPLPICIPPISPQSPSPIIRGWYNRPVVAVGPKVPPHKLKKKKSQKYLPHMTRWLIGFSVVLYQRLQFFIIELDRGFVL